MIPFVDFVAAPAALLIVAGLFFLWRVLKRLPTGNRFLCTRRPPKLRRPNTALGGYALLFVLGLVLWVVGTVFEDGVVHFFGMITLVGTAVVCWATAWSVRRSLRGALATLEIEMSSEPEAVFSTGDTQMRVPLTPASVRAWTVGNGASGPLYLQLALGPSQESGVALFVAPSLRHWSFSEGASWLKSYAGWSPIARGPELLDMLGPYVEPANADWHPNR